VEEASLEVPSVVTGSRDQLGLLMKYFVLNPHKNDPYGKASRSAILEYAAQIERTNAAPADHLRRWVEDIELHIYWPGRKVDES